MSRSITISVKGELDDFMVRRVKKSLKRVPKHIAPILNYQFHSYGGDAWSAHRLFGFMYFMKKWRKCDQLAQGQWIESAAMLFFLNFPIRHVTENSTGIIHLPIPNVDDANVAIHQRMRSEFITFISSRTRMTPEMVVRFENKRLNAEQMKTFGIAQEIIKDFSDSTVLIESSPLNEAA